jgi:ATP phosphoribosyltransferase regulatory subunit HisZ
MQTSHLVSRKQAAEMISCMHTALKAGVLNKSKLRVDLTHAAFKSGVLNEAKL